MGFIKRHLIVFYINAAQVVALLVLLSHWFDELNALKHNAAWEYLKVFALFGFSIGLSLLWEYVLRRTKVDIWVTIVISCISFSPLYYQYTFRLSELRKSSSVRKSLCKKIALRKKSLEADVHRFDVIFSAGGLTYPEYNLLTPILHVENIDFVVNRNASDIEITYNEIFATNEYSILIRYTVSNDTKIDNININKGNFIKNQTTKPLSNNQKLVTFYAARNQL